MKYKRFLDTFYNTTTLIGAALALLGPTLRSPFEETAAMLPPPAPISIKSMVGTISSSPLPGLKRF